jgi:hypothetical protein
MDPFNVLSIAPRKIPPLKDAPPTKVMSCALVASTDLEKTLDAAKEVTGGDGVPLAKKASRKANCPSWPAMLCGQSVHRDEGQSPTAWQGSPYT